MVGPDVARTDFDEILTSETSRTSSAKLFTDFNVIRRHRASRLARNCLLDQEVTMYYHRYILAFITRSQTTSKFVILERNTS